MKKVLKYELKPLNSVKDEPYEVGNFTIPGLRMLLDAQYQGDVPVLWVVVDDERSSTYTVRVFCVGTGHGEVPTDRGQTAGYIATLQKERHVIGEPYYVWHLFAIVE